MQTNLAIYKVAVAKFTEEFSILYLQLSLFYHSDFTSAYSTYTNTSVNTMKLILPALLTLAATGLAEKTCTPSFDYCAKSLIDSKGKFRPPSPPPGLVGSCLYIYSHPIPTSTILYILYANKRKQASPNPTSATPSKAPTSKMRTSITSSCTARTPGALDTRSFARVGARSRRRRGAIAVRWSSYLDWIALIWNGRW